MHTLSMFTKGTNENVCHYLWACGYVSVDKQKETLRSIYRHIDVCVEKIKPKKGYQAKIILIKQGPKNLENE